MSEDKSIQSFKPIIRYNKNFVYKDKNYPIDFNLIKNNSNYFYERQDNYANIHDIQLTEELINISEDCIPSFISSCHNDSFEINNSNVFSLYQLSIKYEVPSLISLTDNFINQHGKTLIFQSLQYKYELQKLTTNSVNIENDEEYISLNFFEYINNEQLLNLPISVLYRIINNPKLDINQLNETNKNQLIDFLFKCLNKYNKDASILFLNLDLENQRIEIFSKLINEYSDVFDFNMISPKFLMKTTTDLLSEMVQLKHNYSDSILKINRLLKQIEDEKQKQKDIFDSFKQFAEEQLKKETEKLNDSFQNLKAKIKNENKKQQDLNDSFKQFAQEQLKKETEKLNDSFQNLKKQIENDNENSKKANTENINNIKYLVNQNNDKMNTFITRDIIYMYV